jgi:serine/threonine-protein phosphatase 2A regulatory subunit B
MKCEIDKTIKLWKVRERQVQMVLEKTANPLALSAGLLKLPPSGRSGEVVVAAAPRRVYGNAHAYHIHSVSACCDGETFLSADDLRVNLWHVEHPTEHHCVLDIKPASIEDLTEVITSAKFHPTQCNLLAFSSSKGNVRLCDLRDSAVIDGKYALTLSQPTLPASQGSEFFGEIISSISDLSFAAQAPHLLAARDFMTVKLWDLRNDALPLCTLPVHDYVRPKLCDLYESDGIFDKFNVVLNPTGQFVVTGSYGNRVRILPTTCAAAGSEKEGEAFLETLTADKSILTTTHPHSNSISPSGSRTNLMLKGAIGKRTSLRHQAREVDSDAVDYDKRVLLAALSPHNQGDCIAVAASANLFLFSSSPSASSSPSSASASSVSSSSWANQLATDRNGSRRR